MEAVKKRVRATLGQLRAALNSVDAVRAENRKLRDEISALKKSTAYHGVEIHNALAAAERAEKERHDALQKIDALRKTHEKRYTNDWKGLTALLRALDEKILPWISVQKVRDILAVPDAFVPYGEREYVEEIDP